MRWMAVLLLLVCLPVWAAPQWTVYLNNRPFAGVTDGSLDSLQVDAQGFGRAVGLPVARDDQGRITINGKPVEGATTVNGVDYVPLKAAVEAAGCTMEVHRDLQMIDIRQQHAGLSREEYQNTLMHARQVLAPQQMDYLYGLVRDQVAELHLGTEHVINTHWCSTDEIHRLAGGDAYGYTSARVRGSTLVGIDLYVPLGLAPSRVLHSMAHELGHCWQYDNGIYEADPMKLEGFAEWVASKVLANLTMSGELANMQANMYPQYRDGLAFFQKVERERGMAGVLEEMQAAARH
ncbi:MAG: hypothetical protein ACYCW6_18480 [Candidatus Xenobia bacterium]